MQTKDAVDDHHLGNVRFELDVSFISAEMNNSSASSFTNHSLEPMKNNLLFEKLRDRMRRRLNPALRKVQPFSFNFTQVEDVAITNGLQRGKECYDPFDVKISYNHQCILVSAHEAQSIQVFDLQTRKLQFSISTGYLNPCYMAIEENYSTSSKNRKYSDALLLNECESHYCNGYLCKYDLESLLELQQTMTNSQYNRSWIWKADGLEFPEQAIVVYSIFSENMIYVCDSGSTCVRVISANSGTTLSTLSFETPIHHPYGLLFTNQGDLLISQGSEANRIELFRKNENSANWKCIKTLQNKGSETWFVNAFYLHHEKETDHIIVSACDDNELQVFTNDGTFVKSCKIDTPSWSPIGICLNELTGELYVCGNNRAAVRIYK